MTKFVQIARDGWKCEIGNESVGMFLTREHLPRVHDPVGVEKILDLLHQFNARLVFAIFQRIYFGVPNAMFSRDGSVVRS